MHNVLTSMFEFPSLIVFIGKAPVILPITLYVARITPPTITTTPAIFVMVMGCTGEPSHPKCDITRPPITWPASSVIMTGPAPTWGMSHAIANTSEAPKMPAVSNTGWTFR